jgi:hypothetical protein
MVQTKSPALAATSVPGSGKNSTADSTRPPRKWERVLRALVGGRSLNRFEAEYIGDHCLHSTVSELESRGVRIDRQAEVVPGRFGRVHCKRYRLAPDARQRAAELLRLAGPQGERDGAQGAPV